MESGLPPPPRAAIALVHPQGAGNIGSAARVMANFGLEDLLLIAPRVDPLCGEARAMACAAQPLLERARIFPTLREAIADRDWVCATTARVGERRRALLTPRSAISEARAADARAPVFVFGPEDTGLCGKDLDLCHQIVSIPSAPGSRSLNLAQAVAVMAYEWYLGQEASGREEDGAPMADSAPGRDRPGRRDRVAASAEEIEAALEHLRRALDAVGYFRQSVPEHPMREFRRLLARARPSRYELAMLRGVARRILNALQYGAHGADRSRQGD